MEPLADRHGVRQMRMTVSAAFPRTIENQIKLMDAALLNVVESVRSVRCPRILIEERPDVRALLRIPHLQPKGEREVSIFEIQPILLRVGNGEGTRIVLFNVRRLLTEQPVCRPHRVVLISESIGARSVYSHQPPCLIQLPLGNDGFRMREDLQRGESVGAFALSFRHEKINGCGSRRIFIRRHVRELCSVLLRYPLRGIINGNDLTEISCKKSAFIQVFKGEVSLVHDVWRREVLNWSCYPFFRIHQLSFIAELAIWRCLTIENYLAEGDSSPYNRRIFHEGLICSHACPIPRRRASSN